jgi:hypothetical protein
MLLGCGSSGSENEVSGVNVRGRLLENGVPVKLRPDEEIRVSFVAVEGTTPQPIATTAEYNPETGTYEITGPNGKGIPPGEYRVGIVSEVYGGGEDSNRFEEVFDAEITPLLATVGAEAGQEFDIDLRKKTITKR